MLRAYRSIFCLGDRNVGRFLVENGVYGGPKFYEMYLIGAGANDVFEAIQIGTHIVMRIGTIVIPGRACNQTVYGDDCST